MKQQHVPQHVVRGIKKKAQQRLEQQVEEAKLNDIVLPIHMNKKQTTNERGKKRNYHSGPAPSIGYMKQGVCRVNNHNKNERNKRRR